MPSDDEFIKLTKVKAHVSHSAKGKLEQVREHMDSRAAAAQKAASGVQAGKGVFTNAGATKYPSSPVLGHDGNRIEKAGHPGASLEEARKAGVQEPKKPLSDEEYAKHTTHIEQSITAAIKSGKTTDVMHGHGKTPDERRENAAKGIYSPERAAMHKQIVDEVYNRQAHTAKSEGKALITGGLGGAGKSTILKHGAGIDSKDYITANPDDMKEELAKRGAIPDVKGLSPMERSALVHEESSHLANLLAKRAYANKKNVAWDITMSSAKSTNRRIDELHNHGYQHTKGVFVDIPVEHSVTRALQRHRRGLEDYRSGHGHGGRYVPPEIIRANKSDKSSSANRDVFEATKHRFDSWEVHDNSGGAGENKKVASSEDKIDAHGGGHSHSSK